MNHPHHWPVAKVADWLHLSEQTVRALIADGELPASRLGRTFLIPVEEVARLLDPQADSGVIPKPLSIDEVAEALACSRRSVYYRIKQGQLPAWRVSPRRLLIADTALQRTLGESASGSSPQ